MILRCILCGLLASVVFSLLGLVNAQDVAPLPDLGTTSPAPLAPEAAPASPQPRKKVIYREKSYFEFEDTLVNGNLRAPDGSFIFRKSQNTFSSALGLKRSFIPELKASSQDAR